MIKIKASLFKEKESYTVYVSDVRDEDSYIVYSGINKILVYDYDHNVAPGDTLTLTLKINSSSKSYLTDFDYESYLFSKGISLSARVTSRSLIKHGFSINSVKYYYLKYLKNNLSEDSYNYVLAMVFGDNNLEDDIKDGYSALGISHVLAISGLHILFLYKIISFIMLKLFHYYRNKIPIILITMFVLFIGAPASCLRALLFLIIGELNKSGNTKYTRLDILSISCILMLIYSPYFVYQAGFLLSFLVNFVLIYSNEIIGKSKSKLLGSYKT
ncbi:MAG: ComEC family competence protein, partial [Acholeplasmatales bacterium]|nr:ComEC family competence protein [Acholeplasmatales bacterium]